MALGTRTYDPTQVAIIVNGLRLEGFADGEMVTIDPDADVATKQVGADGQCTRSINPNKSARMTVRLQQTSPSNTALQFLFMRNSLFDVTIADLSGNSIHSAESGWIAALPPTGYGNESGVREWMIDMNPMNWFHGSNV